jgi:hypothetical protein
MDDEDLLENVRLIIREEMQPLRECFEHGMKETAASFERLYKRLDQFGEPQSPKKSSTASKRFSRGAATYDSPARQRWECKYLQNFEPRSGGISVTLCRRSAARY